MGKIKRFSAREICNILKKQDFKQIRQKGSHIVMQRQIDDKTFTVIIPDHKEIKIGTLSSIIRQSGLDKSIFSD